MFQLNRHPQRFFLIIISCCLIISCSHQTTQKVTDSRAQFVSSECHMVQHEFGETCIPSHPQRIIVTDENILDPVLALGFQPIAAAEQNIAGRRGKHLGNEAKDILSIGKDSQINIERIVELKPDLILGFFINFHEYELLSQIAPTIKVGLPEDPSLEWHEIFQRIGEILNERDKAQSILNQYEQRVIQLRQKIKQEIGSITISICRFYANGRLQFDTVFSFSGAILQDLGISAPPQQLPFATNPDKATVLISLERIDLLDADVLFVMLDPGSEDHFNRYRQSPLWQKLNVVRNNRVYTVDSGYWYFGNILAANAILDDVEAFLLKNTNF